MNWLISDAYAEAAGPAGQQAGGLASLVPFIFVLGIFYIFLVRPGQKKFKQHQDMVMNLKRGDRVITGGGIIGTITKLEADDTILVEIADGVIVQVAKATVVSTMSGDGGKPAGKKDKSRVAVAGKQVANDN